MSIPVPLAVRLKTALADRYITADLRDLSFRSTAPGGFASASFTLDRPLGMSPVEIAEFATVYVYDTRNGMVVWEGRLEDPGRVAGDGQLWQVAAVGPAARAQDMQVAYIAVDRRLNQGLLVDMPSSTSPYMQFQWEDEPPALRMVVPQGTLVDGVSNEGGYVRYNEVSLAGQHLARVQLTWDTGMTDGNWKVRLSADVLSQQIEVNSSTAGGTMTLRMSADGGTMSATETGFWFDFHRESAQYNAIETTWAKFTSLIVRAKLKNKSGGDITSGYTLNTVYAHEVVADLLGRFLSAYDGAGAAVATNTYPIQQLAYSEGVTPAQILGDLMLLEPAFYWAAWESNAAGKNRFEWSAWPTSIRHELDASEGVSIPGSASDLYNEVLVRYKTSSRIKTLTRTQSVPALTDAGLTRRGFVDLGDNIGTQTDAEKAGDQFLAEHAVIPGAGSIRVTRPVVDLLTGRTVDPWALRPGVLIRVRGLDTAPTTLNATARDGTSVFRAVSTTFDSSAGVAMVELDSYTPTIQRALATLAQDASARRRA